MNTDTDIVIEIRGPVGSGKTTVAKLVSTALAVAKLNVWVKVDPDDCDDITPEHREKCYKALIGRNVKISCLHTKGV
jgi:uridine kinase